MLINLIKYFKTSSVVFEILNALYEGFRSDTDLKNKRVRFTEYILSPLIKKIYNLVLSIYKSSKVSFKIPQTTLVDVCNVSDIVHHNLTINPVTEIASLCQITLTGPGGFKKSNVPAHLKNINDTHFGRICPADTPDRDGCGVILNMVPTVKLNSLGMFEEPEENNIISYPISLTPFLEHDDQIRLQMASSQIKQSIYIRNSESPNIKSGLESEYLNKSTFLNIAKNNGEVIYLDDSFMVVKYQDGTGDVFKLKYKELYLNTLDYVIPCFNMGDMFKEGEVLSHSTYIKNDELTIGQNLLTGIGIWKGFNYEDGIVISDRLINEQKFTSIHNIDLSFIIDSGQVLLSLENDVYKPLPVIGEKIKKGGVCAKIKTLVEERGCESINIEPHEITAPLDCKIINIEIYPNTWNKKVDEFNKYIEGMQWRQINKFVKIYNELIKFMSKEEADNFCKANNLSPLDCKTNVGKYTIKDQKFTGVLVKISAIYKETIGIGDKIANRHGNKGVISKILPRNKMPKLEDGRVLDIILNPLGIISRMNVGQLYELHLSECLYQIKQNIKNIKDINDKIKYLSDFLDIIDIDEKKENSKKILKEFELNNYDENILFLIQTPFKSIGPKELMRALEYSGAKFKQSVFDPTTNSELKRNIAVGYNYFLKLVHRASDKISSRSIGPYSQKTMQPLGGKSNQGGHRVGEMEVWALESHGATKFLKDLLTVHSDSSGLKNKLLSDIIQNPSLIDKELTDTKPQSLRLLESYLKILGLEINFQEETDGRK
jgi:DNA-directed RNA polymerase subunit beta